MTKHSARTLRRAGYSATGAGAMVMIMLGLLRQHEATPHPNSVEWRVYEMQHSEIVDRLGRIEDAIRQFDRQ